MSCRSTLGSKEKQLLGWSAAKGQRQEGISAASSNPQCHSKTRAKWRIADVEAVFAPLLVAFGRNLGAEGLIQNLIFNLVFSTLQPAQIEGIRVVCSSLNESTSISGI